ncbi:hypothetical protein Catovirus_1_238 [Catovirus CTV1]|uniref:Uncharacterized protein n=1 Tax=Catovirus CTV1 TaxID=1977631 RepID=A0A1V0S969_9VIRU|nr:hypothetical protein Catovirus_1_238 [Catovirus CTV1]
MDYGYKCTYNDKEYISRFVRPNLALSDICQQIEKDFGVARGRINIFDNKNNSTSYLFRKNEESELIIGKINTTEHDSKEVYFDICDIAERKIESDEDLSNTLKKYIGIDKEILFDDGCDEDEYCSEIINVTKHNIDALNSMELMEEIEKKYVLYKCNDGYYLALFDDVCESSGFLIWNYEKKTFDFSFIQGGHPEKMCYDNKSNIFTSYSNSDGSSDIDCDDFINIKNISVLKDVLREILVVDIH